MYVTFITSPGDEISTRVHSSDGRFAVCVEVQNGNRFGGLWTFHTPTEKGARAIADAFAEAFPDHVAKRGRAA